MTIEAKYHMRLPRSSLDTLMFERGGPVTPPRRLPNVALWDQGGAQARPPPVGPPAAPLTAASQPAVGLHDCLGHEATREQYGPRAVPSAPEIV